MRARARAAARDSCRHGCRGVPERDGGLREPDRATGDPACVREAARKRVASANLPMCARAGRQAEFLGASPSAARRRPRGQVCREGARRGRRDPNMTERSTD